MWPASDPRRDAADMTIIYDGSCGMCAGSVAWIARRDMGRFRFMPSQSPDAAALLSKHGFDPGGPGSIVVVDREGASSHSTAILRIAGRLRFPWNLAALGVVIPRAWRDAAYRLIARNRHRWSRAPRCPLPADRQ